MEAAAPTSTRSRLVSAARERFAHDGTMATTLDQIRRDAEVSVGSLYHHFPRKENLAAAVYAEVMQSYQMSFLRVLDEHPTAQGGIGAAVEHHAAWVEEHRADAILLLGERHESEALSKANDQMFRSVRAWWTPHATYGVLARFQPGLTEALWFGPVQEYVRVHLPHRQTEIVPSHVIAVFANAAWNALRATEEGSP